MTEYEEFAVWCWFIVVVTGGGWKLNAKGSLVLTYAGNVIQFPLRQPRITIPTSTRSLLPSDSNGFTLRPFMSTNPTGVHDDRHVRRVR